MKNIKITNFFYLIVAGEIFFFIIFGSQFVRSNNISKEIQKSQAESKEMMKLANRLKESSDELTRFARAYCATGDKSHLENFRKVLDIRDGKIPRPLKYSSNYWHVDEKSRSKIYKAGEAVSLNTLIHRLPYTKKELEFLDTAHKLSDKLTILEDEAFKAMDGMFKDAKGGYTVDGEPNKEYALNLLYSQEYMEQKKQIMTRIGKFVEELDSRLKNDRRVLTNSEEQIQTSLYFIIFLFLVFNLFVVLGTLKKILKPISSLNRMVQEYSIGKRLKLNVCGSDEIGDLCKSFFYLTKDIDSQTQKLNELNKKAGEDRDLLSSILDNTNAIICVTDKDGYMININSYGEDFVSYSKEQIASKPYFWSRFLPNRYKDKAETMIKGAHKGKVVKRFQSEWISKNDKERFFDWSNSLIKDEHGNMKYLISVGIDITKERRTRSELFQRQKQLELAAQISGLAFWELDLTTKTFTFNDLYYNFLDTDVQTEGGYEMHFETFIEKFLTDKGKAVILDALEDSIKRDEDFISSFEFEMQTYTGRIKQVLVNYSVVYDELGNGVISYGTNFDLTEIKHNEYALQELNTKNNKLLDEQKTLLSLFDKGDTMLFKWRNDAQWSVEYASKSVEKFFGYKKDDFLSSKIVYADTIYGDDLKQVMHEVQEEVKANSDFFIHKPYRVVTKDGSVKWVLDYTVTQKNKDGEITHFIGYIIDISLLKQKELELKIAKEMADKANKSKSEFLANMSHEIRTPLNGVIGLTELALKTDLNQQQKEYLTKSINSSKALLEIINDILDYSKIEANKLDIEHIEFKLDHMMYELSDLFAYRADSSRVFFACEISPNINNVFMGDPFRIKQVLTNLIGNAIKFTKEGSINIYVELVSAQDSECVVKFSVKDSGIGISKEKQKKLFKSFSQVDTSNTREYGGTGLGLSISKKLVELMGGTIGVKSEEGKGSEFFFDIKLQCKPQDRFLQKHNLDDDKLLVICNDESIGQNFVQKAERLGLSSVYLKGFDEALAYLKDYKADHIIVYFSKDEIDNVNDIIDRLRPLKHGAELYISSRYTNRFELEKNIANCDLDVKEIIYKPFTASSIYDTLTSEKQKIKTVAHNSFGFKVAGSALLVEDNEINQLVALQNLQSYGLEVDIANDGSEGVQKAKSKNYDIIFMDLQMPNMDGFEAAKKIRENDTKTPIVALSAAVMQEDKELTKKAGMDEHLAKPIVLEELQSVLKKYFKQDVEGKVEEKVKSDNNHIYKIDCIDADELLERTMNNYELAEKLLIQFYDQYKDTVEKIQNSEPDSKEFDSMMHALKGVSGNLSITKLYELSKSIYNRDPNDVKTSDLEDLVDELKRVLESIKTLKYANDSLKNDALHDKKSVIEIIDGYIGELDSGSFISDSQADKLYNIIREYDEEHVGSLKGLISSFEYKKAKELLSEIKERL